MTDLVTEPGSDAAAAAPITPSVDGSAQNPPTSGQPLEWAPREPAPKKRRLGLWIGLSAGVVAIGAVAASLILIAPGTSVAGISVGWLTPGAAAETISARLAETEVTLTGAGGDAVVTGADLGAALDAQALADQAFSEHPMWNLGSWGAEAIPADIVLDPEAADRALRAAVPEAFTDATDAGVVFDAASASYVTTPAASGTGIDVEDLSTAFVAAIGEGKTALEFPGDPTEALPEISAETAEATAAQLNEMLPKLGFYVGEERTVPVAPEVAASWITVEKEDGELKIDVDQTAIQSVVDTLPAAVNREVVNAATVTNSSGKVLRELTEGVTGRELGDVSTTAGDFAEQISAGQAAYQLPVEEVPFATSAVVRKIEVDLTKQRVYMIEDGNVIDSWAVSTGRRGTDTETGHYTVNWKLTSQNMGRKDTTVRPFYYQPNVKWVMYYNGDQALHGVYWHSNWGTRMSHGCVGMPESRAKQLYQWSPQGLEVWVHN